MKVSEIAKIFEKITNDPDRDHRSVLKDAFESWLMDTSLEEDDELIEEDFDIFERHLWDFISSDMHASLNQEYRIQ